MKKREKRSGNEKDFVVLKTKKKDSKVLKEKDRDFRVLEEVNGFRVSEENDFKVLNVKKEKKKRKKDARVLEKEDFDHDDFRDFEEENDCTILKKKKKKKKKKGIGLFSYANAVKHVGLRSKIRFLCFRTRTKKKKKKKTKHKKGFRAFDCGDDDFEVLEAVQEDECGNVEKVDYDFRVSESENDSRFLIAKDSAIRSSGFGSFRKGDIVWAKDRTWWPGWVCRIKHLRFSVKLFGSGRMQWFRGSEIRHFEENYVEMSKTHGKSLSAAINCALEELGRRAALGLLCCCWCLTEHRYLIHSTHEVKKGFQPVEMLVFVLKMAKCAWIEDIDTVSAVRGAAQVSAYRHYISIEQDWIYHDTMRPFESCLDSDVSEGTHPEMKSHSSSEEVATESVIQEGEGNISEEEQANKHQFFPDKVHSSSEICRTSREDFSIFFPNEEFESLHDDQVEEGSDSSMSIEKDVESEFFFAEGKSSICIARQQSDAEESSSSSYCSLNTTSHAVFFGEDLEDICDDDSVSHLHGDACSGSFSTAFSETGKEKHQDGKDGVASKGTDKAELLSHVGDDGRHIGHGDDVSFSADIVDDRSDNMNIIGSSIIQRDMSGDYFDVKRNIDLPVISDLSQSFSSDHESDTSLLKTQAEVESQLPIYFSFEPQVGSRFKTSDNECRTHSLLDILRHLRFLASDPFYSEEECSTSLCQKLLTYRNLMYKNIPNLASIKFKCQREHKVSKVQKRSRIESLPCLSSNVTETCSDDEICVAKDVTGKTQLLSHVCSHSMENVHDGVSISCTSESHHELEVQEKEEICRPNPLSHLSDDATMTQPDTKVDVTHNGTGGAQLLSHVSDGNIRIQSKNKEQSASELLSPSSHLSDDATKTQPDTNVGVAHNSTSGARLLSHVSDDGIRIQSDNKEQSASELLSHSSENGAIANSEDGVGVANDAVSVDNLLSHRNDDHIEIQPSEVSIADNITISHNGNLKEICSSVFPMNSYKGIIHGKRKLDQPITSDISRKSHKPESLSSLTKLYASPLMTNSLISSAYSLQSSETRRLSTHPISLHMKFPKDFTLPSKDELEKNFIKFGPLDHSRTKVFFFTGSAQVFFLRQCDAEAAYQYTRENNIFGLANVRFWLDPHENARRGTDVQASLSKEAQSALNLKSCLKISNVNMEKEQRKPKHVKFLIGNQVNSLPATVAREK